MVPFTKPISVSISASLLAIAMFVSIGTTASATITVGTSIDIDPGSPDRQIDAYQVAFSPTASASKAYSFNGLDDTVVVINPTDNSVLSSIALRAGAVPAAVAFLPDGSAAFTANYGNNSSTIIRTSDDSVVRSSPVKGNPYDVTISPNGKYAMFSCYGDNTIKMMSTKSGHIVKTYRLRGSGVWQARFTPNSKRIYAVANTEGVVIVIDAAKKKVITKISMVGYPWWLDVSPDGTEVLVTDYVNGNTTVNVIDVESNEIVERIPVGSSAYGVAYDPSDGLHAYVVNDRTRLVSVIDTTEREVVDSFTATGTQNLVPTINPAGTLGYIGDRRGLVTTFTPR